MRPATKSRPTPVTPGFAAAGARRGHRRAAGLRSALRDESGVMTAFGLFTVITLLILGGYAVDFSSAIEARTRLQVNTDVAAHAALLTRQTDTAQNARAQAIALAYQNMPKSRFGPIVGDSDIVFGTWDASARKFTPDAASRSAVKVTLHEDGKNGNAVATYLLKLVGFNYWDISTSAVFATYQRSCMLEGFVAENNVDIRSNNDFKNGFCIHSNGKVSLNNNNTFEPGTSVSMPGQEDLEMPASGSEKNDGLTQALRYDSWDIRLLNQVDPIINGLAQGDASYMPSYVHTSAPKVYPKSLIQDGSMAPGVAYTASCNGNSSLKIASGTTLKQVVLITDCKLQFGANVTLEDVVIASSNSDPRAITGAANVQLGRNDNCAPGGGVQILTDGGMDFPAKLSIYGSQMVAKGDISFAANANGVQGASLVSGDTISGTSNMTMAFCGQGMEQNYQASYFKMVQ